MMFRMSELRYDADPRRERALDVLLMVHADHEQSAATTAVRAVGSTSADPYAAVAAGISALSSRCAASADRDVLRMLRRIERPENVAAFLEQVRAGTERLTGFGHGVYRTRDPRGEILRRQLSMLHADGPGDPLLAVADELAAPGRAGRASSARSGCSRASTCTRGSPTGRSGSPNRCSA